MQFTTLALAALTSLASSQTIHVVTVGMNKGLTFMPNNLKVPPGEMVQFQFVTGNHTASQSTFDAPCQPSSLHGGGPGFHSGFQPAADSLAKGMVPTYTVMINDTKPIWAYCAQGKHCQNGMVMVINENTAANASRSLESYKAAAKNADTLVPGGVNRPSTDDKGGSSPTATVTGSGSRATGSGSTTGSSNNAGSSPNQQVTPGSFGTSLAAPSILSLLGLATTLIIL